ncbi:AP2-like ethylene-responsive transcription factor AIL6 [Salvia splendens]|uniref:AP2-like ethylene-responsive transcription factor AIL6 n=1 Tax=Salvia splendens TaxID=180675 RepID=UPI001C279DEC|nr:AP2-like ethylene-responsive transcription factor AIL6 [Salvia splendens]
MAPDNNWLSFSLSLSSMEMLNSSSSSSSSHQPNHSHHYYSFGDNFYTSGWPSHKSAADDIHYMQQQQQPPKLEDFFAAAGDSTETQDSSLTHIYDHHHHGAAYFDGGEQQDLKSIIGFQAFSANSASNVDDSPFAAKTQSPVESATELAPYSHSPATAAAANNGLSLDVCIDNNSNTNKAVVATDSKKIADTFGQRTSIYRGVTRHRWTGRYEAHLWDNSCRREGQARKGRQVYLGGYDKEDKAARSYDLAALKYWGPTATTNFPMSTYAKEVEEMKHMTKQEFIASLRRKSSGFSRGASIYRGVTRHHQQGRWQARIGRVAGNKDLYLGTFATEEEAAEAYDIAAIKFRGINAVTNFEMNRYDVEAIAKSPLPIGGAAKRLKHSLEGVDKALPLGSSSMLQTPCNSSGGSSISFAAIQPSSGIPCGVPVDNSTPYYHHNFFHHLYPNDPVASDTSSSVSSLTTPMNMMPAPGEYFVWPHHTY